jgi:Big-like domain-containing protein
VRLSSPVVGITADRGGYLVATRRGDVYAFGARFRGSPRSRGVRLSSPVVGITAARGGYLVATASGAIYLYGARAAAGRVRVNSRIVAIAATTNGYMVATAPGQVSGYLATARSLGSDEGCVQPSPPLPPAPDSTLVLARRSGLALGGPISNLAFAGGKKVLEFLFEGAADWGLGQGLDAGLGWILDSLGGGENEKSQIDPAVIAQQFANVDARLDALGNQQYQDCQAVLKAIDKVQGTVLQTAYDLQALPLTGVLAQIQTDQKAFNLIALHLIENGGNVDALPVRDKQAMIAMTSNTDGLPHIIDQIDAYEETTVVPDAHSLIASYNRILLHNYGYEGESDSPFTTHIFPSSLVDAAYTQQNTLAAAVAQAAYLYTNVDHVTFTFDGHTYQPDKDAIKQVTSDAQKNIQSWSHKFTGDAVNVDSPKLPGIGMLPANTVLDYRGQNHPILWTDGPVSLNGEPTSPTPYYCANPAPFCYANRYNAAGAVALTALARSSVRPLPALIGAQSNDGSAAGWQSLMGWRIPTTSDWNALQAGASGGLSAWGARNHMNIFDSEKITSLYAGRGTDLTIIAPVLVNTGTAAAPSYGVLSSADPSANALTLEPRPFPGPDPENDFAGRLVLARDFTPTIWQPPPTASAPKAKKRRLHGKKPSGYRHRRRSHRRHRLALSAPVTYTNPTSCSQPDVYTVPDGAGSIRITATGGGGAQGARLGYALDPGSSPRFIYNAGGKGGVVTETIPAVAGSRLYVQVGGAGSLPRPLTTTGGSGGAGGVGGGGSGGPSRDGKNSALIPRASTDSGAHSGGGGGASGATSVANCSQWLVVGGGGGGGGAGFINLQSSAVNNYFTNGGSGGSGCPVGGGPECAATDASPSTTSDNAGTLGRAGGSPPNNGSAYYGGADGATMQGGAGGPGAPGGGGGGAGGGYYGGGGGGGGGGLAGGGGGGGGASFAIPGLSGAPSYGFGAGTPTGPDRLNYVAAAAGSVTITPIAKPSPALTLSASSTQVVWGQPPSLTAKLPADATGIVGFYDDVNGGCDGNKSSGAVCQGLGTAQIMNGIATLPAPTRALSVGSHLLHASYGGDNHYLPSSSPNLTVTVAKANPAMNLQISGTILSPGQSIKSIAVVMPADVTGTVAFYDLTHPQDPNGKDIVLGTAPIKNGSAMLQNLQGASQKLAPGPNLIRASYTDDTHYTFGNSNTVKVIAPTHTTQVKPPPVGLG